MPKTIFHFSSWFHFFPGDLRIWTFTGLFTSWQEFNCFFFFCRVVLTSHTIEAVYQRLNLVFQTHD